MSLNPVTHYDRQYDSSAPGGDDHIKMFKISSADYSQRPARKQVDSAEARALQQVCDLLIMCRRLPYCPRSQPLYVFSPCVCACACSFLGFRV
jgi:hypothetical protein